MKTLTPEKVFINVAQLTETRVQQAAHDMALFIALIEAASFQLEKFRSLISGPDRAQLNNLKSHLDGVVRKHRAAEKEANPKGYGRYEEAFDMSAELIIDALQAMRKGELQIEDCTQKAA